MRSHFWCFVIRQRRQESQSFFDWNSFQLLQHFMRFFVSGAELPPFLTFKFTFFSSQKTAVESLTVHKTRNRRLNNKNVLLLYFITRQGSRKNWMIYGERSSTLLIFMSLIVGNLIVWLDGVFSARVFPHFTPVSSVLLCCDFNWQPAKVNTDENCIAK